MKIGRYAPSGQFTLIALSVLLSTGLVYGANYVTHPKAKPASIVADQTPTQPTDSENWQAALYEIQANNASSSLTAPDPQIVQKMLQAAQSNNITDTVGKTLLINIGTAKSQGLGDDIPTQEQIIAQATAQVAATKPSVLYKMSDLTVVPDNAGSLKAYGNGVIQIINLHPAANESATLFAVGNAVDHNDASQLEKLPAIGQAYQDVAMELLALPVPRTLSPLHLTIVNDYIAIVATYPDQAAALTDPLRGIVGMQTYERKLDEITRVFTNIAQNLNKDGILFNKDDAGSVWKAFLTTP